MLFHELEDVYLTTCDSRVRKVIQDAADAFPDVAEMLTSRDYKFFLVLNESFVRPCFDPEYDWEPETDREKAYVELLVRKVYSLSKTTLVNAMVKNGLNDYEHYWAKWPLVGNQEVLDEVLTSYDIEKWLD